MLARAVQAVDDKIRIMKVVLEDDFGESIDAEANVVMFMAGYASYFINRLDGKTPLERKHKDVYDGAGRGISGRGGTARSSLGADRSVEIWVTSPAGHRSVFRSEKGGQSIA